MAREKNSTMNRIKYSNLLLFILSIVPVGGELLILAQNQSLRQSCNYLKCA